jgi:hypothetical protein
LKNDLINWVLTLKSNGKFDTQWKPLTAVGLDRNIGLTVWVYSETSNHPGHGGPMSLVIARARLEILESGYEYLGMLFHVSVLYSYIGIGRNELF